MIYADHERVVTDAAFGSAEWQEWFEDRNELACRLYGRGAAFVVEADHVSSCSYEARR